MFLETKILYCIKENFNEYWEKINFIYHYSWTSEKWAHNLYDRSLIILDTKRKDQRIFPSIILWSLHIGIRIIFAECTKKLETATRRNQSSGSREETKKKRGAAYAPWIIMIIGDLIKTLPYNAARIRGSHEPRR